MATAGNNRLGGDDFDQCIVNYLLAEFKKETKVDISKDIAAMQRVREAAEKAKIELSGVSSTNVNLPYLTVGRDGPVHMDISLTRAKFNQLTSHLVEATVSPMQQALSDSGLRTDDLSKVLLVGGSTRIPAVQDAVKRFTGKEPFKGINPDECVAMGAALQGGVLGGQVTGLLLLDVTPLSLGIETLGGICTRLIERNTTLPITKSQIFSTAQNFQTSVEINVLPGERQMARDNKSLGKFKLTGIRRAMRGVPQIEVTFNIDANGIVNVSAKDLGTGKQQAITITASSNLSQADIDRAIYEAQQYAAQDQQMKEEATAKDELEQLMYQAQAAKKLTKEQKQARSQAIKNAAKARKSKDTAQMRQSISELKALIASFGSDVEYDENAPQDADFESMEDEE